MIELDLSKEQVDIRKILLIGPEGVGKTRFLSTMPKPVYIFSTDKGYLTLAGEPGITIGLCMDENRYSPHAYADFKQKFDALKKGGEYVWPDGRKEAYKTIAIDSLTFLSNYLYDHEARLANTIDKPGGFAVYGAVKSKLQDIVGQAVMLAPYVVCTALVETTKDDITGEIFFVPSMVGSMKNEVGAWFDAVFYMTVDKNPTTGAKTYKMLTVGDRRQKAKIRLPSSLGNAVQAVEEPDFGKLMDKIKQAQEKEKQNGKT